MKEIKDDTNVGKYTTFINQRNQYIKNEYTTQSNLQIQCNPYQTTNGIFHGTRTTTTTTKSQFVWKQTNKQKKLNSQCNIDKEKWSRKNQPF